jgi:hypothetical protein
MFAAVGQERWTLEQAHYVPVVGTYTVHSDEERQCSAVFGPMSSPNLDAAVPEELPNISAHCGIEPNWETPI